MFDNKDIYEYLMHYSLQYQTDIDIWKALATKLYLETHNTESNLIFDVLEKAKRYNITIPDPEMLSAWDFIKNNVEGKDLTPEQYEKLVEEYGYTAIKGGSSPTSI